ncbi:C45 family autoproteolytic acyltransferase/hydolase [Paenibacillus sp. BAC0078]
MKTTDAFYMNFSGTNYQVGEQLAAWVSTLPEIINKLLLPPDTFPQDKLLEIMNLFNQYCPGVNEEIEGFADKLGIAPGQVLFYAMSYLERGCSLMASLPEINEDGHTLMACTFDFNDEMEDLCLTSTRVNGRYAHTSTLGNIFGRTNGMNEHGLAVCQSSNGMPVGNFEGGLKAAVSGLTFWSIIRSLLENCKNIEQALVSLKEMPIGYNLNLLLADSTGKIALFECLNGSKSSKTVTAADKDAYICATNHTVLPELISQEKVRLENSVHRYSLIQSTFSGNEKMTKEKIRTLLTKNYPDGLCCHYYQGFFGLLHAVIFDIEDRTVEIVFGSPQNNPWRKFQINQFCENRVFHSVLPYEEVPEGFYTMINL